MPGSAPPGPARTLALLLGAALLLAGCSKHPVGQVLAVVDGDEITRAEVKAELRSAGESGPAATRAAIDRLVERRLLAQAARAEGIDRSQAYLLRSRQLTDGLLAQMLDEQTAAALPAPTDDAVAAFMASNPAAFAGRTIYTVDVIRLPGPLSPALRTSASLAELARQLDRLGLTYRRGTEEIDSATLDPDDYASLNRATTRPIPFGGPTSRVLLAVVGRRPSPVTGKAAHDLALRALGARQRAEIRAQRLAMARARARIEIRPAEIP